MDLSKSWPYLVGAGLILLLLILGRSGGPSAGAATMAAMPTSNATSDALSLQTEQNRTALLGTLANAATALQGAVNGYRGQVLVTDAQYAGEATLADINARAQTAIADVNAKRDVSVTAALADRDITVGKANARAATAGNIVGGLGKLVSGAVSAITSIFGF